MTEEVDLVKLARVRKAVERSRAARDRALGERDQWLKRIKDEFGTATAEEAEAMLNNLERQRLVQEKKAQKSWEEFCKTYPEFVGVSND